MIPTIRQILGEDIPGAEDQDVTADKPVQAGPRTIDHGHGVIQVFDEKGNESWYKNRLLHRDGDLPAYTRGDGTQEWYRNGELHRDGDKPAIIRTNGDKVWCKDGFRHRDGDKPAVIRANGEQIWYQNGEFVRDNIPTNTVEGKVRAWSNQADKAVKSANIGLCKAAITDWVKLLPQNTTAFVLVLEDASNGQSVFTRPVSPAIEDSISSVMELLLVLEEGVDGINAILRGNGHIGGLDSGSGGVLVLGPSLSRAATEEMVLRLIAADGTPVKKVKKLLDRIRSGKENDNDGIDVGATEWDIISNFDNVISELLA